MTTSTEQDETVTMWTEEALQRLRRLVKGEEVSAWEIGDELLRLLPVGEPHVNTGVAAAIRKLAAEVDAEPRTLTAYRKVAHAWPEGIRIPSATWAAHQAYMGPPSTAAARAQTLEGLPRNEHGKITVQAVRDLTKGNTGKPGWHELLGRVGDTIAKAQKELNRFEQATVDYELNDKLREKATEYAYAADTLARGLRRVCASNGREDEDE